MRRGEVKYAPPANEENVPPRFRLPANQFSFEQQRVSDEGSKVEIFRVTFPSPVKTPHEANNTVHCDIFGRRAAANVAKCRALSCCIFLAAIFRCRGCSLRRSLKKAARRFREDAVLWAAASGRLVAADDLADRSRGDHRRDDAGGVGCAPAGAWLAAQDEVDAEQLGVFGISLGGITASLVATAEPRFTKICPMLAGGDIARVTWESRELAACAITGRSRGRRRRTCSSS